MYEDDILREVWRVKDKLAAEYARNPDAYWDKLRQISQAWKSRGGDTATRRNPRRASKRSRPSVPHA
jgi:hypothetical protein